MSGRTDEESILILFRKTFVRHAHTQRPLNKHMHTDSYKHIHSNSGTQSWGVGGGVPANLGLPVSPLPFFPLTFTCLPSSPPFLSSSLHTNFLCCYWWTQTQLQLNAVQTMTHMQGMPHINMWRDRRRKVRGGRGKRRWGKRSTAEHRLCTEETK